MHVVDTLVNKVAPLINMKFHIKHLNGNLCFNLNAHHVCFIFSFPFPYHEQPNNVEVSNKISACTKTSVSTRC